MKKITIIAMALTITSALWGANTPKPFDGKVLKVLSFRDNHSEAVLRQLKTFEDLTGAKIKLDLIASNTVATKTATDQMAGGSYDLYTVDEPFIPQLSTYFVPMTQWPKDTVVPAAELNWSHFLTTALEGASFKGVQYGLPVQSNVYMYVYRSDLFESPQEQAAFKKRYGYDLKVPETTEQYRDVAEFFTRPPKLYGFAPFTKKSEGTTVEAMWILGTFGVKIFDDNLNVILDVQKTKEAFQFYKDMMAFAPRGAKSWHHSERMASWRRGKLAQIMTWPGFLKGLEDPLKSRVVGKNAYGVPPKGPQGQSSPVSGTWALAMAKTSKNKELAAAFARWWGSFSFGKNLVAKGMNPARIDLLKDQDLVANNPWFPAITNNFQSAIIRPRFPEYRKVSDKISFHFTNMVVGSQSPEDAAANLKKDLVKLASGFAKGQTH